MLNIPTLRFRHKRAGRISYDRARSKMGSKRHWAVDKLGHLLMQHATPHDVDDYAQVSRLAGGVQATTGGRVEIA